MNRTFIIPSNLDDATALVLEEIGCISMQVRHSETIVMISADDLCYFWKRLKEETSFSYSGIHYSHYKAAAHSERLSHFLHINSHSLLAQVARQTDEVMVLPSC